MVARAHQRFAAERGKLERRWRRARAKRRVAEPDRDRRAQVRDHQPPSLPGAAPRDRDVAAEGAQLLRRRAQLGARAASGTRATSTATAAVRGETSPHYTNLPRFGGVAERMRETLGAQTRLIYMVRDPIERILSHYLHNVGGGYETPLDGAGARPIRKLLRRALAATRCSSSPTSGALRRASGS